MITILKCKALMMSEMSDLNPYQSPTTPVGPMEGQSDVEMVLYEAAQTLAQTKPWVRFLSVLGILLCGLAAFTGMAVFMGNAGASGFGAIMLVTLIPIMILCYLVPSILLWRYASRIGSFLREQNPATLAVAMGAQKTFWMYVGALAAIGLVFYLAAMLLSTLA